MQDPLAMMLMLLVDLLRFRSVLYRLKCSFFAYVALDSKMEV
jgi:hypothetical protein